MCRCWLSCWEDFYWNCIEEKFCYDQSIANYNPDDDEYFRKKSGNGFLDTGKLENNNSAPVCIQPASGRHNARTPNISAGKIHEEDYRQIQTNAPFLAPEIMSVFANSQIFHEHHPVLKKPSYPGVHGRGGREADYEKLLFRLEGSDTSAEQIGPAPSNIQVTIEGASDSSTQSLAQSRPFSSIRDDGDGVILRPRVNPNNLAVAGAVPANGSPIQNKRLRNVQSVPYFPFRPASENDIFSISGSMSQISMTPELPSTSYSTLPKHYEDTPTIEKYKESVSLYSIQTANRAKEADLDFSMPRYFRRSDIIVQSADNLNAGAGGGSGSSLGMSKLAGGSSTVTPAAKAEKSKRLKLLRTKLPPLSIHLGGNRERSKDKGIE